MRHPAPALCAVLLAACASAARQPFATPTATLRPYRPAPTAPPVSPQSTLLVRPTPGPSPTPLTHVVARGDTLLGIALQYGVELEDLLVANPGINPRFLSVGQAIVIPGPGGSPTVGLLPTATPVPIGLGPPACYRSLDGSVWCLTVALNPTGAAVEGVGALVTLGSAAGEPLRSEPAYASLNLLQAGKLLPLSAFFAPPVPEFSVAQASLTSAVSAAGVETRYAAVQVALDRSEPGRAAATWIAAGEVRVEGEDPGQGWTVALTLLALDDLGRPAGLTKSLVQADPAAGFELTVASLGPPIARVELLAEAPIPPAPEG